MKKKTRFLIILTLALILPAAMMLVIAKSGGLSKITPSRPEGPCDIYAAAKNPCVAAHSTTRALYASYNGPLYQVMRLSDGKKLDIGVVQPSEGDPGGYADAAAQDAFCANTYCWITTIYDQSGKGNHLVQAPRGGFSGPAMGGFNNIPIADMAPITLMDIRFMAFSSNLEWVFAGTMPKVLQSMTRLRVSTGSLTDTITTMDAATTMAMQKLTVATTATVRWKRPIMATPIIGITGKTPAPGS